MFTGLPYSLTFIILMFMEHAERTDEAMDVIVAGGGPAGLLTAALLDVAGARAEVCERGSEPTRQSRGTAMHPRTLEVLTMLGAGDGRRISGVLLAQGRRVLDMHYAVMPDLLDRRGLDTPFPFTLTARSGAPSTRSPCTWTHAGAGGLWSRGDRGRGSPPMRHASR
jgi:FAD binding domain